MRRNDKSYYVYPDDMQPLEMAIKLMCRYVEHDVHRSHRQSMCRRLIASRLTVAEYLMRSNLTNHLKNLKNLIVMAVPLRNPVLSDVNRICLRWRFLWIFGEAIKEREIREKRNGWRSKREWAKGGEKEKRKKWQRWQRWRMKKRSKNVDEMHSDWFNRI